VPGTESAGLGLSNSWGTAESLRAARGSSHFDPGERPPAEAQVKPRGRRGSARCLSADAADHPRCRLIGSGLVLHDAEIIFQAWTRPSTT